MAGVGNIYIDLQDNWDPDNNLLIDLDYLIFLFHLGECLVFILWHISGLHHFVCRCLSGLIEFSINGKEIQRMQRIMINHWNMNLGKFRDFLCYLCHPGTEVPSGQKSNLLIQCRRHQKFKTEVSVAPQKGLMSSRIFYENNLLILFFVTELSERAKHSGKTQMRLLSSAHP